MVPVMVPSSLPITGGDDRLRHVQRHGVHQAFLQSRAAVHQHRRYFLAVGLKRPPAGQDHGREPFVVSGFSLSSVAP